MDKQLLFAGALAAFLTACSSATPSPSPDAGAPHPDGGSTPTPDASYVFPPSSIFYQDISSATVDSNSSAVLAHLADAGGWGTPGTSQLTIDFTLALQYADNTVQPRAFTPGPSYPTPDCDTTPVPVPPSGWIGGAVNYQCNVAYTDCLLLVYQGTRLFELFGTTIAGGTATGSPFTSQCEVAWDTTRDYWQPGTPYSRGDQCQSADPSGLPIAPLLATGDELQAGLVPHALRFRLPPDRIRSDVFVHPSTHRGLVTGDALMPPFGARLRLKSTFPVNTLTAGGATLATALQTYGMYLAATGTVPLTLDQSANGFVSAQDLASLQPTDFEIVAPPSLAVAWTGACQRTPLVQ